MGQTGVSDISPRLRPEVGALPRDVQSHGEGSTGLAMLLAPWPTLENFSLFLS